MILNCLEIGLGLKLLKDSGNNIAEIVQGWSNMKEVFQMSEPLSSDLKEKIELEIPLLKYWKYKGSPHNAPGEGFYCEEHKIAISFPMRK